MLRNCCLPAALLVIPACTVPQTEPSGGARACFWASEASGFTDGGAGRALVRIGARETWELTVSPGCADIDWAMNIGIRAPGGERICPGRPAELLVPEASGRGSRSCLVRTVRRLSPEEAAARRDAARQ